MKNRFCGLAAETLWDAAVKEIFTNFIGTGFMGLSLLLKNRPKISASWKIMYKKRKTRESEHSSELLSFFRMCRAENCF
jgi:hypothetical protein